MDFSRTNITNTNGSDRNNMGIRDQIMQMAAGHPDVQKAVDAAELRLQSIQVTPKDIQDIIQVLEFVMQNPDKYQEVRAAAIKDGEIREDMFPPQFDAKLIVSILIALYGLQDRLSKKMARGGLASMAESQARTGGRGGDTELVHVNPREAEMLRRMGGSGTVNPNTGLREYKGGILGAIGSVVGAILPIAAGILLPGIGGIVGSALIGGASSALSGGNFFTGALTGGISGGLGAVVGKGLNSALGAGMSAATQNIVGSGIMGGLSSAVSGKDVLTGVGTGVAGGAIGNLAGNIGSSTALDRGLSAAAVAGGNAITAGYSPEQALTRAALSGAYAGMKPSEAVVNNMAQSGTKATSGGVSPLSAISDAGGVAGSTVMAPMQTSAGISSSGLSEGAVGGSNLNTAPSSTAPSSTTPSNAAAPATDVAGTGSSGLMKYALPALMAYSSLSGAPEEVQQAVPSLSASQQEYFNRPSVTWDWDRLQKDAASSGMGVGQFISQNWNKVSGGGYNNPVAAAKGGALNSLTGYAKGSGSGRADTINARLSDGEYVFDAESVALIGDGSSEEGARRLNEMRNKIREHKGKALAKGRISPNAKSPLSYLKGAR
jgi:hypothetical protein